MLVPAMLRTVLLLSLSAICGAQSNCPAEFRYVGTMSASGSSADTFNGIKEVRLPKNVSLDKSYQQSQFKATNGKGGAKSNMTAKDVPAGIELVAYGTEDFDKGWAVSEPHLRIVKREDGSTDFLFGMRLFCSAPQDSRYYGTCQVSVDICYKPMG